MGSSILRRCLSLCWGDGVSEYSGTEFELELPIAVDVGMSVPVSVDVVDLANVRLGLPVGVDEGDAKICVLAVCVDEAVGDKVVVGATGNVDLLAADGVGGIEGGISASSIGKSSVAFHTVVVSQHMPSL